MKNETIKATGQAYESNRVWHGSWINTPPGDIYTAYYTQDGVDDAGLLIYPGVLHISR